ncbi:hypothetical protein AAD018_017740 [Aestuariibius insulae]|uniref:hypothetical protein n=1 Tax=Aestuariibius insulae TaxID=2058287 RepID=UPI00345E5B14
MHIDLLHSIISAVLILGTLWALRHFGVVSEHRRAAFDWRIFLAVVVVMFIFNLIWPLAVAG